MTALTGKAWTRQAVWSAEQGKRSFPARELLALAYVLGSTVEELMRPPADLQFLSISDSRGMDVISLLESRVPESPARDKLVELQETVVVMLDSLSDVGKYAKELRELARQVSIYVSREDM